MLQPVYICTLYTSRQFRTKMEHSHVVMYPQYNYTLHPQMGGDNNNNYYIRHYRSFSNHSEGGIPKGVILYALDPSCWSYTPIKKYYSGCYTAKRVRD